MESSKRADLMTKTAFRADHLADVKQAFVALWDLWLELAEERQPGQVYELSEVVDKLTAKVSGHWKALEEVFVKDTFHGYSSGDFTQAERRHPAKLIFDLVQASIESRKQFLTLIHGLYDNDKNYKKELRKVQEELVTTKEDLNAERMRAGNCLAESRSLAAKCQQLEQLNQEKTDTITQLQRDSTVELWQREKTKIETRVRDGQDDFCEKNKELEAEKILLKDKIKTLEEQVRRHRIKTELNQSSNADFKEIEESKKNAFILQKDVRKLDDAMFRMQKAHVGFCQGLQADYWKTFRDLVTPPPDAPAPEWTTLTRVEARRVGEVIDKALKASRQAALPELVAGLPSRYTATDADIKERPMKKLCNLYGGRLSPMPRSDSRNLLQAASVKPQNDVTSAQQTSAPKPANYTCNVTESGNPQMVHPITGHVDMIQVMKIFPHMTVTYVTEQWQYFKQFDKNGDGSLDLPEVMSALSVTMGDTFKPGEINEAMQEVDCDGSNDLDFYEYLCIANNLIHKKGTSEVYQNAKVQNDRRSVTKVCIVM